MNVRAGLLVLSLLTAGCASQESDNAADATDQVEPAATEEVVTNTEQTLSQGVAGVEVDAEEAADEAMAAEPFSELCDVTSASIGSRVEVTASGNRVGQGSVDFSTLDEVEVELPDDAIWVTADPGVSGGWYVVLSRGSSVRVSPEGVVTSADPAGIDLPPELGSDGLALSPLRHHDLFSEPLPDSRVVIAESIAAALVGPTTSYPHAVLGDGLEASAVQWVDTCTGESGQIDMEGPDVIEGISPILYDIDSDGQLEIIVTISNASVGARLAAFDLDGTLVGESEPIGQGNRWRNQLAVGPFGPSGQIELIDVRTPHIGGTVEAFRLIPGEGANDDGSMPVGQIIQVAQSDAGYTSHEIGSRNLSLAIGLDANTDSIPDVIVPSADLLSIVAMTRTDDLDGGLLGWNILGEQPLTNGLSSNIATQELASASAAIALGDGNILRIWR